MSNAYDVAYQAALNGRPYNEFAPRGDYARGYMRGQIDRQKGGEAMPHTDHRPVYRLKHDERVRVTFRHSGDVVVSVVDRDDIVTMTLDLEFGQALELRDGINRAQAQRHDSIPVYAGRERPTIPLTEPA